MSRSKFPGLTNRTPRNGPRLARSVEELRRQGFWTNIGESVPDVMGIAPPLPIFGDLYGTALVGS